MLSGSPLENDIAISTGSWLNAKELDYMISALEFKKAGISLSPIIFVRLPLKSKVAKPLI